MADKTRYSDDELAEFKTLIEEKLEAAKEQLDLYKRQIKGRGEGSDARVRGLDDSVGSVENERLTTLAGRQQKYIEHLKNALLRIENKVYGVCRESGKLISKERLMAVPHATLSIDAKESSKKGKRR